jgi:Flp pilus assembly protein TadD
LDAAGAAAKSAIDLGGDTPYTLSLYAQVLERQGKLADAERIIDRAVQREPRNAAYRHRSGRIALMRGDRQRARAQFEQTLEIDPGFAESWLSLASLCMDEGDLAGAEASLRSAGQVAGLSEAVHFNLQARLAILNGDLDAADALATKALGKRRDSQNLMLAMRIAILKGEAKLLTVDSAKAEVRRIAKELDGLGQLADVLDLSKANPLYF